jgi:predicted RNA binding protein YcfA (HicA-like mRNA interferase family)
MRINAYREDMNSKEVLKRLRKEGFEEVGRKGSHVKMRHMDGRMTIVPDPRKDLPPGLLKAIERQAKITF